MVKRIGLTASNCHIWANAICLLCAYLWSIGPLVAQALNQTPLPSFVFQQGVPISIDDADKALRARFPSSGQRTARTQETGAESKSTNFASFGDTQTSSCGSSTSQPVEIATLAASLKCDIDLIFEYVYNNIEYEPLFGSNKGALGTLLDQRGNDIDQAQLFTALLSAAGYSSSQYSYVYGYIVLLGPRASSWLGVANDLYAMFVLFANGGVPVEAFYDGNGTIYALNVAHVWVQVNINGVNYQFDPSYKSHTVSQGVNNLGTALGYSQSQFLSDAGGVIDSVSIGNINRANVRNNLAAYANNLNAYIKSNNPSATLNDIVGGKAIDRLTGSPLRQTTLPLQSPFQPAGFPQNWGAIIPDAYRTCFTISMPGVAPTQCGSVSSQTIQLFADETYGRRISISSVSSGSNYIPTLLIEGAAPSTGQSTGTPGPEGTVWNVSVCIRHAYVHARLCNTNPVTDAGVLSVKAGGTYVVGAAWGQVNRGMVEKHRKLLEQARTVGQSPNSEIVLGESLSVIGYTWLAENSAVQRLSDQVSKVTTLNHHTVGIVGQSRIQNTNLVGPYIDLPFGQVSNVSQTYYGGGGLAPVELAQFFTQAGIGSSLESAVLEQTQAIVPGIQAASTIRIVDINASTGARTYFADGTIASGVAAYFNTIRPNLTTSYAVSDLSYIDCSISTNCLASGAPAGAKLLLPANGNLGVNQWHGAGYTAIRETSTFISIAQKISGGLSGGFAGNPVSNPELAESTATENPVPPATPSVPPGITATAPAVGSPSIADPVDAITGAYVYQNTDLVTGGGDFPYALPFARNYLSAANGNLGSVGKGWSHNFNIAVSRSSNPFAGLGETSPISAAGAIAAIYVMQDLLANGNGAQKTTLSWMVARWLTDQLTNNSVSVAWPSTSEEFILLPGSDNRSVGVYNSPLGSAVELVGAAPNQYGQFTAFTYRAKDQTLLTFGSTDTSADGKIAGWSFANGMSVGFEYGYTSGGKTFLTNVSNNLGRSLTLSYNGGLATAVTDDTGRTVSLAYDAQSNLQSVTNPLQFTTVFNYDNASRLTQIFYPSNPGGAFLTNTYDALGRVSRQANANGFTSYFYLAGSRTEFIDAQANRRVSYQTPRGKIIKEAAVLSSSVGNIYSDTAQQNGLVNVSTKQYDGLDRLIRATAPEGGRTDYTYDSRSNVLTFSATTKPGSGFDSLTTTYAYDPTFNKPVRVTDPRGLVSTASYDAAGNLTTSIADFGAAPHFNATTKFTYDGRGLIASVVDPLGTLTLNSYDDRGNRTSVLRDAGGGRVNQLTTFEYSPQGDIVSVKDPNGNVSTRTYDANRQLLTSTSPRTPAAFAGVVTRLTYDADGRMTRTEQTSSNTVLRSSITTYTPAGKIATSTDPNGNITRFSYDALDQLTRVLDAEGRATQYVYDALGRRTQTFNPAIQAAPLLQQAYTPDGLLASLTDANGNTTSFAYDGFDRLVTTTNPFGIAERQTYDNNGNVLTRSTRSLQTITFAYDTLNRLITKTLPLPAPVVSYSYDLNGRLRGVNDTSAAIQAVVPPSPATSVAYSTSYVYDALNRPVSVSWSPAPNAASPPASSVTFNHAYNRVNQRVGQTVTDSGWINYPSSSPSSTSYTSNALNQYTAVGAVSPNYDNDGNLRSDGFLFYGYDAENRLVSSGGGGLNAAYAYDAQGRRKAKAVSGVTTRFVTDADNREVLEYDGASGAILRWYAYGLGPNDVFSQMNVAANTRTTFIPDLQGSIIASVDSSTGAFTKAGYLPYGKSATTSPFAYTGQRLDPESGGLYYYRARHYSPTLGRFMQPDPIGYTAGANLYAYVGNDPLNLVDPSGLAADGFGAGFSATFAGNDTRFFSSEILGGNAATQVGAGLGFASGFVARTVAETLGYAVLGAAAGRVAQGFSGTIAAAPVSRALTAADIGVAPSSLTTLEGTFTVSGGQAVARIGMIEGQISNPFGAVRSLSEAAKNAGAKSLTIEGSVANPALLRALTNRYGAETIGGIERITVPLR